ncbi:MAG: hypothetical protein PHT50_01635 [Candidatus Omnitrophica bacterium]|nr:hypothetical protein [Candidatus Omnitrophota bacterium]
MFRLTGKRQEEEAKLQGILKTPEILREDCAEVILVRGKGVVNG